MSDDISMEDLDRFAAPLDLYEAEGSDGFGDFDGEALYPEGEKPKLDFDPDAAVRQWLQEMSEQSKASNQSSPGYQKPDTSDMAARIRHYVEWSRINKKPEDWDARMADEKRQYFERKRQEEAEKAAKKAARLATKNGEFVPSDDEDDGDDYTPALRRPASRAVPPPPARLRTPSATKPTPSVASAAMPVEGVKVAATKTAPPPKAVAPAASAAQGTLFAFPDPAPKASKPMVVGNLALKPVEAPSSAAKPSVQQTDTPAKQQEAIRTALTSKPAKPAAPNADKPVEAHKAVSDGERVETDAEKALRLQAEMADDPADKKKQAKRGKWTEIPPIPLAVFDENDGKVKRRMADAIYARVSELERLAERDKARYLKVTKPDAVHLPADDVNERDATENSDFRNDREVVTKDPAEIAGKPVEFWDDDRDGRGRWRLVDAYYLPFFREFVPRTEMMTAEIAYEKRKLQVREQRGLIKPLPEPPKLYPATDLREWLYDVGAALKIVSEKPLRYHVDLRKDGGHFLAASHFPLPIRDIAEILASHSGKNFRIHCPYRSTRDFEEGLVQWTADELGRTVTNDDFVEPNKVVKLHEPAVDLVSDEYDEDSYDPETSWHF